MNGKSGPKNIVVMLDGAVYRLSEQKLRNVLLAIHKGDAFDIQEDFNAQLLGRVKFNLTDMKHHEVALELDYLRTALSTRGTRVHAQTARHS